MSKRKEALLLRLQGLPYSAVGERLGISRQRAQQLVSPPRAIRREVVLRADGRCADCHLIVGKSGHVHHKASVGAVENNFNDLSNLVLLCPSCHFDAHYPDGVTPFERDLEGIKESDALIFIAANHPRSYNGANVEVGMAFGLGKPVFSLGILTNSAMYWGVKRCVTVHDILQEIAILSDSFRSNDTPKQTNIEVKK